MTNPNIRSFDFDHIRHKFGNKNFDENIKLWQDQGYEYKLFSLPKKYPLNFKIRFIEFLFSSSDCINKIINQDLSKDTKKKSYVHLLTDMQKKPRKINFHKLWEALGKRQFRICGHFGLSAHFWVWKKRTDSNLLCITRRNHTGWLGIWRRWKFQ